MKLELSREWFEKNLPLEEGYEVGAGRLMQDYKDRNGSELSYFDNVLVCSKIMDIPAIVLDLSFENPVTSPKFFATVRFQDGSTGKFETKRLQLIPFGTKEFDSNQKRFDGVDLNYER